MVALQRYYGELVSRHTRLRERVSDLDETVKTYAVVIEDVTRSGRRHVHPLGGCGDRRTADASTWSGASGSRPEACDGS